MPYLVTLKCIPKTLPNNAPKTTKIITVFRLFNVDLNFFLTNTSLYSVNSDLFSRNLFSKSEVYPYFKSRSVNGGEMGLWGRNIY